MGTFPPRGAETVLISAAWPSKQTLQHRRLSRALWVQDEYGGGFCAHELLRDKRPLRSSVLICPTINFLSKSLRRTRARFVCCQEVWRCAVFMAIFTDPWGEPVIYLARQSSHLVLWLLGKYVFGTRRKLRHRTSARDCPKSPNPKPKLTYYNLYYILEYLYTSETQQELLFRPHVPSTQILPARESP